MLGRPKNVIIGIEDNKPEAIAAMQAAAENSLVEIISFPTKYPSGGEKQLIQILTGKEVPQGEIPANIGIVVQNVGTAAAIYKAVCLGEPLISRVTTVVGETLAQQRNIDVLIGTPLAHVLKEHGFKYEASERLIIGGPMMGFSVPHAHVPIVKTTNCVLAPTREELPPAPRAQACIRCGMCATVCPASLLPQQLFWFSQSEDFDKLRSHNLADCIECGACSFVCPSNIPLVQYYRASKGSIRQIDEEKQKSDRSRERFEFRKARIEKAEAEKDAKRLARKKAAELAKTKMASQPKSAPTTPVAPPTIDPATQGPKLERALSSAQSRLERADKHLNEALKDGDQARIEALKARQKEAQLKSAQAQKKLDLFKAGQLNANPLNVNQSESKTLNGNANDLGAQTIKTKVSMGEREKQEKTVSTLKKRIATAKEKYNEAQSNESPTASALKKGIEKLEEKLRDAQSALTETPENEVADDNSSKEQSAAEAAIEKAKVKAHAMANMSDADKNAAKIESLKQRLDKARIRLSDAEKNNGEHIDALRSGVEKLEEKLSALQ
ncbi:MAG: electron transport complex protein RnfC [Flavobacteriales bacterium]